MVSYLVSYFGFQLTPAPVQHVTGEGPAYPGGEGHQVLVKAAYVTLPFSALELFGVRGG